MISNEELKDKIFNQTKITEINNNNNIIKPKNFFVGLLLLFILISLNQNLYNLFNLFLNYS